jgi:hypothetical protein
MTSLLQVMGLAVYFTEVPGGGVTVPYIAQELSSTRCVSSVLHPEDLYFYVYNPLEWSILNPRFECCPIDMYSLSVLG